MALQNALKTTKSLPSDSTPFDPAEVNISKMGTSDLIGYERKLLQKELEATKNLGEKEAAYETAKAEKMQPVIQAEVAAKNAAQTGYETEANKIENLEFKPSQETYMSMAGIASLTAMVGLILGKTGGFSGQSAIDSMTGMLKGYQQGKADIFKQEQAKYEKDTQAQKANIEKLKNKLEIALKKAATDREGAEADVAVLLAQQYGSDYLKAKYNREGIQGVIKGVQQAITASQKRDELAQKAKIAGGKALGKDILPEIQGVRGINSLMRQLDDPEVKAGLTAKLAPFKEKVSSIFKNDKEDFENAVNRELTGTDKTTLFLKDALLETYAIERAAKGGQRLTVQDMKMVGPVLDPTNYKPETYKALLDSRRRSLYNNLQDKGMSVQEINTRAQEHPYESYSGEKPKAPAGGQDNTVLRSQAKARIAAGGDEEAVKKRFKDLTGEDL